MKSAIAVSITNRAAATAGSTGGCHCHNFVCCLNYFSAFGIGANFIGLGMHFVFVKIEPYHSRRTERAERIRYYDANLSLPGGWKIDAKYHVTRPLVKRIQGSPCIPSCSAWKLLLTYTRDRHETNPKRSVHEVSRLSARAVALFHYPEGVRGKGSCDSKYQQWPYFVAFYLLLIFIRDG
eukprot:scaffold51590_cov94-Cyclotella_meneghiniana.AAC.2